MKIIFPGLLLKTENSLYGYKYLVVWNPTKPPKNRKILQCMNQKSVPHLYIFPSHKKTHLHKALIKLPKPPLENIHFPPNKTRS